MSSRAPIRTAQELAEVMIQPGADEDVREGYHDGLAGDPEPGGNRSRAYWHGWRNGRVDGGHAQRDEAQAQLARDVLTHGHFEIAKAKHHG